MTRVIFTYALFFSATLFAQKGNTGNGAVKNPNPVKDAVIFDEKSANNDTLKSSSPAENGKFYDLQEAVKYPVKVTSLKLRNCGLKEVPKEISTFENLAELDLTDNNISSLSGRLTGLKNLQVLNLSGNELTEIPAEIGSLKNLHVLNLSANKIIGGSVTNTGLEQIYLNNNQLTSLPSGIISNTELRLLYLQQNQLTDLDENLLKLPKLESLLLQLNKIQTEPSSFADHKGLLLYRFEPQNTLSRPLKETPGESNFRNEIKDADSLSGIPTLSVSIADRLEDYLFNIHSADAGNGFRRVKIGDHQYKKISRIRLMMGKPVGVVVFGILCPMHWWCSPGHRNNWRLSKIDYKQRKVEDLIAKGSSKRRISEVKAQNKKIIKIYRRYLKDNKTTSS